MSGLRVVGAGMTPFGRHTDQGLAALAAAAVRDALDTAGLAPADVGSVFAANAVGATVLGQEMVAGQVALRGSGLAGVPVFNVENACASGQSAFHLACAYVTAGLTEVALVLGVERMTHADKLRPLRALAGAVDVDELGAPESQATDRSFFMDLYARKARHGLERGATREDFGAVTVKNQAHGQANPRAQFGRTMTVEEVLASRLVVDPLTLFMCSPISDGAACVVVTTAERAGPGRGVDVLATSVVSGRDGTGLPSATERAAARAYEVAGVGPADLDLVELHDAAAPAEIELYEELGLAAAGEGPALLRSGRTRLGGALPVNASGGLIAKGHPVGATGVAQLVEGFDQLTGRAGERQVAGARVFLAHNAGGWVGDDNAVASVTVLGGVA